MNDRKLYSKKDCSKSENIGKIFSESEQNEKESELYKGV